MIMLKQKRIFALLLTLVFILAALPAWAEGTRVWAINDNALSVPRSYMGSDWIGYISFGQSFDLLETRGDYARLRNARGNTGWVAREHLAQYDPNSLNKTMYAAADGDILWPHADYLENPIPMKKGDAVTVVGLTPNRVWYRVLHNGAYYYAPYKLLTGVPAPAEGCTYIASQRYVFGSGVDLYAAPYETTEPFETIDDGTAVTLLEVNGSMARIRVNESLSGYTQLINLVDMQLY